MINKPKFEEEGHKYINPLGLQYISVTTFLHQFQPKKDWDKIANKYVESRTKEKLISDVSAKYKIPAQDVKRIFDDCGYTGKTLMFFWEKKKKDACEKGSNFHNKKEEETLKSKGETVNNTSIFIPVGNNDVNIKEDNLSNLSQGIYPELLVWSDKYQIAGKVDKPFLYIENEKKFCKIDDYKTNESILKYNYKDKYGNEITNEYLLYPLTHIPNTNYWIYQLQLNLYGFLLSEVGWLFNGGEILHAPFEEIIDTYEVLDLQKEIKDILEWRLQSLKK